MKALARVAVAAALVLLFAGVAPASAQSSNASPCAPGGPNQAGYAPRQCGVAANRSSVAPGGKLTLTGQCPNGGDSVSFTLQPGGTNLGSTTANPQGDYTSQVTIPSSTAPGEYDIVATCTSVLGEQVSRSVHITVVAAATRAGALTRTGFSHLVPMSATGVGLVLVGSLAVAFARRRRAAAS